MSEVVKHTETKHGKKKCCESTCENDEDSRYNAMKTLKAFKECIMDDMNIDLKKFIAAYYEIIKFLNDLHHFFKFVAEDLNMKCKIIEKCIESDPVNYESVHSAVEYEKSIDIYKDHGQATVTILRLLRGLDFIRLLMDDAFVNMDTKKKCTDIALDAYDKTLAFRQKWTVRNITRAGFYMLPKKKEIIDFMLRGSPSYKNYKENDYVFKEFLAVIHQVYYLIHRTYYENDFLELVTL